MIQLSYVNLTPFVLLNLTPFVLSRECAAGIYFTVP